MTDNAYAIASLDHVEWTTGRDSRRSMTLTESLGCRHTTVVGHLLRSGDSVQLPAEPEHVVVPIDDTGPLVLDDTDTVPPRGVGRVPAGVSCSVGCESDVAVVVVGATGAATPNERIGTLSLDDCDFPLPSTSDIATARLTRPLDSQNMKVNARLLEPGDVVPYHTEGDQEELFVPVTGPAQMRIDGTTYETPPGTVVRVAPAVPRSALNDGETDATWVMFGAPPTGGPDEWDPGADILE